MIFLKIPARYLRCHWIWAKTSSVFMFHLIYLVFCIVDQVPIKTVKTKNTISPVGLLFFVHNYSCIYKINHFVVQNWRHFASFFSIWIAAISPLFGKRIARFLRTISEGYVRIKWEKWVSKSHFNMCMNKMQKHKLGFMVQINSVWLCWSHQQSQFHNY